MKIEILRARQIGEPVIFSLHSAGFAVLKTIS